MFIHRPSNKINYLIAAAGLLMSCLLFMSCEKDCPAGYSGRDCEVRESDAFLGLYKGYINCGAGNEFTEIEIQRKQGPYEVEVNFISTPDFILDARVDGDSIHFPDQWLDIAQGNEIYYYIIFRSSGVLRDDSLHFPVILLYPGIPDAEKVHCQYHVGK